MNVFGLAASEDVVWFDVDTGDALVKLTLQNTLQDLAGLLKLGVVGVLDASEDLHLRKS